MNGMLLRPGVSLGPLWLGVIGKHLSDQVGFAGEIGPLLEVLLHRVAEFGRGVRIDEDRLVMERLFDVVARQHRLISALRRSTIGCGVLAGAIIATHSVTSYPGRPDSAMVGSSGRSGDPLRRGDAERPQLPAFDIALGGGQDAELGIDPAGQQIDHRLGRALVREFG